MSESAANHAASISEPTSCRITVSNNVMLLLAVSAVVGDVKSSNNISRMMNLTALIAGILKADPTHVFKILHKGFHAVSKHQISEAARCLV